MLRHRIIVAAILGPLFLWLIYLGGLPLDITCLILCGLMWHEFLNIAFKTIPLSLRLFTFFLGTIICLRALEIMPNTHENIFNACLLLALFIAILTNPLPLNASITKLSVLFFGLFYCFSLLPFLSHLRRAEDGFALVLLALLTTWCADTAAYFSGRAWGKAKLYPMISPGKTRVGAYGSIMGALICAFVLVSLFKLSIPLPHTLILGLLIAIAAMLGDLAESMLKRSYDVKDSSNILPGHGGILDRFDAFLFVAPMTYCYCIIFLGISES